MSRVLVTGAGGWLGRRLVPALARAGHSVIAGVHRAGASEPSEAEVVALDVTEPGSLAALPSGIETIVHAAAARMSPQGGWEEVAGLLAVNAIGTSHLLRYAQAQGVRRFIYCSTMSVYALPQPVPIAEAGRTYPSDTRDSFYGISKLGGELLCARAREAGWLDGWCLRLARLYGPEEPPESLLAQWAAAAAERRPLTVYGEGRRSSDFLYVDDAVRGILAAVESPARGQVLNLGSGVETTWRELAEAIAETFSPPGARAEVRCMPEGDRTRCCLDSARARAVLGFEARYSLRQGLRAWQEAGVVTAPGPV